MAEEQDKPEHAALKAALSALFARQLAGQAPVFKRQDEQPDDGVIGPIARFEGLVLPPEGWPLPGLAELSVFVGLDDFAELVPNELLQFADMRLQALDIDNATGEHTLDVLWSHGRLALIPGLFELSAPGLRFVFDALPLGEESTQPEIALIGDAQLGGVDFLVSVELPGLAFSAMLARPTPIHPLFEHFGVDAGPFGDIDIASLGLSFDPQDRILSLSLLLGDVCKPAPGFELNQVGLSLTTMLGEHGVTDGVLNARGVIGGIDVEVVAQHSGAEAGWQLSAEAAHATPIPLGDLLQKLSGSSALPAALAGCTLRDLGFSHNTRSGNLSMHGSTSIPINDTRTLQLAVSATLVHHPDGTVDKQFAGRLSLAGLTFDVALDQSAGSSLLAARFVSHGGETLHLGHLLQAVSADAAGSLDDDGPQITLHDALLIYVPGQPSRYLFALDIDLGLDLSGLGGLPLIGSLPSADQALRLSFQPVLTSKAPGTALTAGQLAAASRLLAPGGPQLPPDPAPGFTLITTLKMAGISKVIVLGGQGAAGETQRAALPSSAAALGMAGGSAAAPAPATDAPAVSLSDAADITWVNLQKHFGPLHVQRLGLGLLKGQVAVRLDAALTAGPITLSLLGLGANYKLSTRALSFSLDGIDLDFAQEGASFSGCFLRMGDGAFIGKATLRLQTLSVAALGAYQEVDTHPSLFIYAFLDYPIGGPAFMFVEGLALGFGYNRRLIVPELAELAAFPLIAEVTGEKASAPLDTPDGQDAALRTELQSLASHVVPALDRHFLAVGVKFNSFKVLNGFALLIVAFGQRLSFDLIGQVTAVLPHAGEPRDPASPTLAKITLVFAAKYSPDEGCLGVDADIAPGSFVYTPECHVAGGSAMRNWFSGEHAGDFVFTMGGYHKDFHVPAHYPQAAAVKRLSLDWIVDSHLSVHGRMYFALTSSAAMAGGELDVLWDSGALRAWFNLGLDVLVQWKPYHYTASAYVEIGASLDVDLGILGSLRATIEAGAALAFWGPEFAGSADVHASVMGVSVHFSVDFGATDPNPPPPLSWSEFTAAFLPAPAKTCSLTLTRGLQRSLKVGGTEWLVANATDFVLVSDSAVPLSACGIAPMQRNDARGEATLSVTLGPTKLNRTSEFRLETITKPYPAALWGLEHDPAKALNGKATVLASGYRIVPATPAAPGASSRIERSALAYDASLRELCAEQAQQVPVRHATLGENPPDGDSNATAKASTPTPTLQQQLRLSTASRRESLRALGFDPAADLDLGRDLAGSFTAPPQLLNVIAQAAA